MTTKRENAKTLDRGQYLALASGDRIFVRKWGWDETETNLASLWGILADATNEDLGLLPALAGIPIALPSGQEPPEALLVQWQRTWRSLRALLVDTIEGGEEVLEKVRGLDAQVQVIEAMLEVNGVVRAQGKLRALLLALTGTSATENPEPSQKAS
jgi:hypothetical protein